MFAFSILIRQDLILLKASLQISESRTEAFLHHGPVLLPERNLVSRVLVSFTNPLASGLSSEAGNLSSRVPAVLSLTVPDLSLHLQWRRPEEAESH